MLLRLRDQFKFIKRGLEILKIKRDQLAGEINLLLAKIKAREDIENELIEAYRELKRAYTLSGYMEVSSIASSMEEVKVKGLVTSVMGVMIPRIEVKEWPQIELIEDLPTFKAAVKLKNALEKLLKLAETETAIELLAYELMDTNRKVNALEKIIIPQIVDLIRVIESKLEEEAIEEFVRSKYIREAIRRRAMIR